ncbi:MAG TPA: hypothetical protein VM914_12195, partial [Pyrinomonadaceae bacterium]|nr:hypothetical protein [Pyrinomonadaceae bacterium]
MPLTLLCLSVFASVAEARATNAKDLKRAEVLISKLKRLEEAAASREPGALRKAASKVYPGLFSSVSKLKDSDLKTD